MSRPLQFDWSRLPTRSQEANREHCRPSFVTQLGRSCRFSLNCRVRIRQEFLRGCANLLLLLKLTLAPLLVAIATIVARRWGHGIGGVVVGLPLSSGPIFLFLAIDQGLDFAERATLGILFGLVGLAGFALVYAAVSHALGGSFLSRSLQLLTLESRQVSVALRAVT